MGFGIAIKVQGHYALFCRPEMKAERVSYDVITPSAARAIIEACYFKPAIRWIIDRIHVMNEIRFDNVRRNEVENVISVRNVMAAFNGKPSDLHQYASLERQQRASLLLRDVSYIIEAHFEMTDRAGPDDTEEKHYNIAVRRLRKGQCYYQPYLGCREFSAKVELLEGDIPASFYTGTEKDLGWMLWDIDYSNDKKPLFFRPVMKNGIIEVPDLLKKGGMS